MVRGDLETLIIDALRDKLMAPELVEIFITEFHAEVSRLSRENEQLHELNRRALNDVSRKLESLIEAITQGLRSSGLQERLDELELRKQSIEASIARNASSTPTLHPDLAHLYHRKIEKLQEAVAAPETRAEATEILRSLIESITLTPFDVGSR